MDKRQKRQCTNSTGRNLKRRVESDFGESDLRDREIVPGSHQLLKEGSTQTNLADEILRHVAILNASSSTSDIERAVAQTTAHSLSELAKDEENIDIIVEHGAIPALVKFLQTPLLLGKDGSILKLTKYGVEKECAVALGLIATKSEYQQVIVDAGAVSHIVNLLKRQDIGNGVFRRAADLITNLAHENARIKSLVRIEGGIPPLVELLEFIDPKVQKAAAGALRTLAFRNDENKNQIVELNGLSSLRMMLHSDDTSIHNEAIGVIGNLVHSSPHIKKEVLQAGALQPVIRLLSSSCLETQREAALLIGQFAAADSDCKVHIAQRGAITPLIKMLHSSDDQIKEISAFALGRLAQDSHNQAGIGYNGGIVPLLSLLDMKVGSSQHNAAFALYGLADNEDNIVDLIRVGGFERLQEGQYIAQPTKDCVGRTLKRLAEKIDAGVLNHLLYVMKIAENSVQKRVALALAHLCDPDVAKLIFIENNGLELLFQLLDSCNLKQQQSGADALYKLTTKFVFSVPEDTAPSSPVQQVYLGQKFVNNPTLSDVTFLIEGKRFYAHKICLLASSDAFRAMFDGGYKERDAQDIVIPNITWDVFELMMRFIYTGSVYFNIDVAQDLLRAADQYLLEGLKRICEYTIAQDISGENLMLMYELADAYNANILRRSCMLYMLQNFKQLSTKTWFFRFVKDIIPEVQIYIRNVLTRAIKGDQTNV